MGKFKAIILAGGSGERFWPLSTPEKPKQFLSVFGDGSLIRQSFTRMAGLVEPEDVYVVTASALVAATRRELPEIPRANVVGEPMRRDTGAAVALGVGVASARLAGEDAVLGFFPSDQLVTDPARFRQAVSEAIARAKRVETIVTVGIRPDRPATGFGYVNPKSGRFVEKPDERRAKGYLRKGFLWNAGMFIGRVGVFRAALAEHAPALTALATRPPMTARGVSPKRLAETYEPLPRISFDFAVMEKLARVEVVAGDFGWDDVGSYSAFDKHFARGADGNIALGEVNAVEATGCTAVAKGAKIALFGVRDLVVVTTRDAVLVADRRRVAELKKLFAKK